MEQRVVGRLVPISFVRSSASLSTSLFVVLVRSSNHWPSYIRELIMLAFRSKVQKCRTRFKASSARMYCHLLK